jgi:hypothetical protein
MLVDYFEFFIMIELFAVGAEVVGGVVVGLFQLLGSSLCLLNNQFRAAVFASIHCEDYNTIFPSFTAGVMVSPGFMVPSIILVAISSTNFSSIARLRGRAPKTGSYPTSAK